MVVVMVVPQRELKREKGSPASGRRHRGGLPISAAGPAPALAGGDIAGLLAAAAADWVQGASKLVLVLRAAPAAAAAIEEEDEGRRVR